MTRAFIRSVWGDVTKNGLRNGKLGLDIKLIKENPYNEPFKVYAFGEDNYDALKEMGFETYLIGPNNLYDMKTQLYRYKLDVLEEGMKHHDEIVFLDWDCRPISKLHENFWEILNEKAPFQANLFQYRTKKCLWRDYDWRKVCNGGFLYVREKDIPTKFIQNYNDLHDWVVKKKNERESKGKKLRFREEALIFDDEPAISKWVDDQMGGWKGVDEYWKLFEPEVCNLKKKSAYPKSLIENKKACFVHWG